MCIPAARWPRTRRPPAANCSNSNRWRTALRAIAAPRYKVNSNATVILTNDGVVVVDSHSKPSAALALYREVQSITKQPIKRIINTHFHWDHWQGNQVYAEAYPGLESSPRSVPAKT